MRFFIPGDEENDVTFSFSFAGDFVSAYDSFLTRQPSIYHVEALTDTVLYRISHGDLQDIYQNTAAGNIIGRHAGRIFILPFFAGRSPCSASPLKSGTSNY